MKAVGYREPLPISDPQSLLDLEAPTPQAEGRDLLVEVKAISVNPVDVKVRASVKPGKEGYKILGWDAAGVVKETGSGVSFFKPGDEVYYAGSIARAGTDAEFHLVDERIVGGKPKTLNFAQAAAMPLTTITAWELLFDRLHVPRGKEPVGTLLIMGGAGGVGSILTQLARKLTGLTIISTASTPESQKWCLDLGAHSVINHYQPLAPQLIAIGFSQVDYIASLTGTQGHYPALVEILAPESRLGIIDDPASLDATLLKSKCASLHWEYMFARSFFSTPDMVAQHEILNEAAALVDAGVLRTTLAKSMGTINAAHLKEAHALLESGRARGKLVLEGF